MSEELAWNEVTVIVENGIVTAIAPPDEISIPEEAVVIDASGRWIMPGLSDMHTQLGLRLPGEPETTYPELKADLDNYLPNGVTKIRNMRGNRV
jgi:imidazolonepropionase-like amidohydrolase